MGCWNETCGVSQLPIQQGDKIRVFVLAKSRSHRHGGGGFCENDDAWAPYGFCVQGKYNDYGSIEKVKNNYVTKLLFNKIKDNIDFDNYDEERHYHVNLKSKKLNWTDIVTAISQEEMTLSDTLPGIMFVLEDIYQTLISATRIDTCRDKGGYLYKKLDEVIKDDSVVFFEKMKGIASKRLSIKNKSNDSSTVEKLKLQIQIDHLSDILDNDYNSIVGNQFSGHRHFYLKHYN